MTWYQEDDTNACAIAVVDGLPDLFNDGPAAKAQFPDWMGFEGLIVFDPRSRSFDGAGNVSRSRARARPPMGHRETQQKHPFDYVLSEPEPLHGAG